MASTNTSTSVLLHRWLSPPATGQSAAIAIVQVIGEPNAAFQRLGVRPIDSGAVALRRLGEIDTAVIARFGDSVFITPHAGAAVRHALTHWFASLDIADADAATLRAPTEHDDRADSIDRARSVFPEAESEIEALALAACAAAASPLATDLLLDQSRRWNELGVRRVEDIDTIDRILLTEIHSRSLILNHLLQPPRVVALGPPNIGKSTLLNTLAGRGVSIVADVPGTTRDHVGVHLDLAGLVVHYIDTPGIAPPNATLNEIDAEAQQLAMEVAAAADVLLLAADPSSRFLERFPSTPHVLRVSLRADLGASPRGTDLAVSSTTGLNVDQLVTRIRDTLVDPAALEHPGPWVFWRILTPSQREGAGGRVRQRTEPQ